MKKVVLTLIINFCLFSCKQEPKETFNHINFLSGDFKEWLAQAAKEDKLIFVDCYTSWCAPCKWMDKNVFVKEEVFGFYNNIFVNAKLDMEKGEGPGIGKKYGVHSYPTYLFINSKGELVHKANSKMSAAEFIMEGENAINPEKALGILAKKYADDDISNDEMLDYVIALRYLRDSETNIVLKTLLSRVDDNWLKSVSGWKLIDHFVYEDTSDLFQVLNNNKAHFIDLAGQKAVNKVYQKALQRNMYQSSRDQNETLFFKQFDSLKTLTDNPRDLSIIHCRYYEVNNAEEFIKTSNYYVDNFLQTDPKTIAFIARSAARKGEEQSMDILKQAAYLITKAYKMDPNNYGTVSTYAQIQSEVGNKEEAIKAGELALKMADTISSKVKKRALQNLEAIKKAQ